MNVSSYFCFIIIFIIAIIKKGGQYKVGREWSTPYLHSISPKTQPHNTNI